MGDIHEISWDIFEPSTWDVSGNGGWPDGPSTLNMIMKPMKPLWSWFWLLKCQTSTLVLWIWDVSNSYLVMTFWAKFQWFCSFHKHILNHSNTFPHQMVGIHIPWHSSWSYPITMPVTMSPYSLWEMWPFSARLRLARHVEGPPFSSCAVGVHSIARLSFHELPIEMTRVSHEYHGDLNLSYVNIYQRVMG